MSAVGRRPASPRLAMAGQQRAAATTATSTATAAARAVSYGTGYDMSQVPLIRAGIEEKLRRERARKGALGDALPPGAASDRKVHTT